MGATWTNFEYDDFKCKHCGENKMDYNFIDKLQKLRDKVGFPLPVNSGYRCPAHNASVSSTGANGPHTTGRACDLGVDRERAFLVMKAAFEMGIFSGVGVSQKGATGRFIHLDDLEVGRPTTWSY